LTNELKEIIQSADGYPIEIARFQDVEKAKVNGSINVMVEKNLSKETLRLSQKYKILIISKDQFYNFCLKQHLAHRSLMK
jgi:hypothetical protein